MVNLGDISQTENENIPSPTAQNTNSVLQIPQVSSQPQKMMIPPQIVNHPPAFHLDHDVN